MSNFQLISSLNYELVDAVILEQPADTDERASRAGIDTGETALAEIVTDIMDVSSVDERLVLFLTPADLVKLYLQKGGGGKVVDSMEDAEIKSVAGDLISATPVGKLIHVPRPHKFANFVSPPRNAPTGRAVLIDIPKSIFSKLKSLAAVAGSATSTPAEMQSFRDQLRLCMLHKYYTLTLNIPKTREIRSAMARARDVDGWTKVFNPRVIENFPKYQTLQAAKDEWDEMQGASAPGPAPAPAPGGGAPAPGPAPTPAPPAPPAPAAGPAINPTTIRVTISSIVSSFISSGSFNADQIANDLRDNLQPVPKVEALDALDRLTGGIDADLIRKIKDKIAADQSWT
jgi:hypothetical protein